MWISLLLQRNKSSYQESHLRGIANVGDKGEKWGTLSINLFTPAQHRILSKEKKSLLEQRVLYSSIRAASQHSFSGSTCVVHMHKINNLFFKYSDKTQSTPYVTDVKKWVIHYCSETFYRYGQCHIWKAKWIQLGILVSVLAIKWLMARGRRRNKLRPMTYTVLESIPCIWMQFSLIFEHFFVHYFYT